MILERAIAAVAVAGFTLKNTGRGFSRFSAKRHQKACRTMTKRVALRKPSAQKFDDSQEELVVWSPKSGNAFNNSSETFFRPYILRKKSRRLEDLVKTSAPSPKPLLYVLHVVLLHMP
jgi:hypothetical protein